MKIGRLFITATMAALLCGCGQTGTPAQGGVQDYMPDNAVIAHRGTIYWAPELTRQHSAGRATQAPTTSNLMCTGLRTAC